VFLLQYTFEEVVLDPVRLARVPIQVQLIYIPLCSFLHWFVWIFLKSSCLGSGLTLIRKILEVLFTDVVWKSFFLLNGQARQDLLLLVSRYLLYYEPGTVYLKLMSDLWWLYELAEAIVLLELSVVVNYSDSK